MPTPSEPIYDVDYFIAKFSAIPEERWCVDRFTSTLSSEQHCALGHCGKLESFVDTEESKAICTLIHNNLFMSVTCINDGHDPRYPQPTPKQRILAALNDIKLKQSSNPNLQP